MKTQPLTDFFQLEVGIDDASDIEFQRVHRIGLFNQQAPKPRQAIARFLRYPNRERVMSNARKFKVKNVGVQILLIEEKRCCQSYFLQGRRGSRLILTGRSPIHCHAGHARPQKHRVVHITF